MAPASTSTGNEKLRQVMGRIQAQPTAAQAGNPAVKTDAQQGMLLNVVVGIVGAMLGGWLLAPLFGTSTINQDNFSMPGLMVSLLGAIILLAIVNLVRRSSRHV